MVRRMTDTTLKDATPVAVSGHLDAVRGDRVIDEL